MYCTHKHVLCDEDVTEELFGLLSSMIKQYAEKVLDNNMRPERFFEMFCGCHHFIDCTRPCCMNAHRVNMGIVRNLCTQEKKLLDKYLYKESFAEKDLSELLHRYLTAPPKHKSEPHTPITLGGKLTEEQIACLTKIAQTYQLFVLPEETDVKIAVTSLLQCKQGFAVRVRNIRNAAVFFDELLEHNLISYDWQSIIEKGNFLLSPKSGEPIISSTLSSALNRTKTSQTATQAGIRKAIGEMQKWNITDI